MARNPRARVIKTSNKSKAGIFVEDSAVTLIGDRRHFVVADDRGITIKGPVSIVADSNQVRTGGLFVGLSDLTHLIPSTMWTPLPTKIPSPPTFAIRNIAKDLSYFYSYLV